MNNKLIKTNSLWYKIKTFFKNIFLKKTNMTEKKEKALQTEQIGISELNETEVNEMKEYFTNDIQSIDNELSKIKQHIIAMQQELKQ